MPAKIIDGKAAAQHINNVTKNILDDYNIHPKLAVILAGDDPASQVYVRNKERACEKLGIESLTIKLPSYTDEDAIISTIKELNNDNSVSGILVQLPLPNHLNADEVLQSIVPEKDVDGFTAENVFKNFRGGYLTGFRPCTPEGIINLLLINDIKIDGKHAVIIGRSNIVGKPLAMELLEHDATVTICHSRTQNLAEITKQADILISAVGKPHFVTTDMVRKGAAVIDVGINRVNGELCGDVDFEAVKEVAGYITPVPGGVGPMTIAMLMYNTVKAATTHAEHKSENKVLTLEEVKDDENNVFMWVEHKDSEDVYPVVNAGVVDSYLDGKTLHFTDGGWKCLSGYNENWRCWAKKPAAEERRNTKWGK